MQLKKVKEEVLARVKPTEKERKAIERTSEKLLDILDEKLEEENEPRVVGSVSKGTCQKNPDIDIFVKYPLSTSRETMEKEILEIGREILNDSKEKYAEHPYIYGRFEGYEVDIVPCYNIDNVTNMKSAVDRTPFHTDYIIEEMNEEQKDDAILLKAFLKGIGAYGAKAEVWGFSGYLCELLILKYGSFEELLRNARDWKPGKSIEIKEGEKDFEDPLIVIDPVDPERNVASPVSMEKFALFIVSSKRFLEEPRMEFFFPNGLDVKSEEKLLEEVESRGTDFLGVKIPRPDVVEDNLYPQVQKCLRKLSHQLKHKDFEILHSDFFVQKNTLLLTFELKSRELPEAVKHKGPPVWVSNTESFIEKYSDEAYLEEDRLWVDRKRKYTKVEEALTDIMDELDLGSDINQFVPEKATFVARDKLVSEERESLTKFLDRRFPWER